MDIVKRSEAVFIAERLELRPGGWTREVVYVFEGEEYAYRLHTDTATESEARRKLYDPRTNAELHTVFLRDVHLDMLRKH